MHEKNGEVQCKRQAYVQVPQYGFEMLNNRIPLQTLWSVVPSTGLSVCCSAQRVVHAPQLLCQTKSCSWGRLSSQTAPEQACGQWVNGSSRPQPQAALLLNIVLVNRRGRLGRSS